MQTDSIQHVQHLMGSGRIDEARLTAERMAAANPGDAHAWFLLGSVLAAAGRPVIAAESLRKAHALAPGNQAVAENLYQTLIQAGQRFESLSQTDGAESAYREAVDLDPERIPARLRLGQLLSAAGRYQEARSHLQAVLSRQPGQADALAALALSHEFEGDYTQAMEMLRAPLTHRPLAPPIALAYAAVARHLAVEPDAIALLEELVQGPVPETTARDIHFALGKLYDSTGDYDRAFDHYQRGNQLLNFRYDPEQTRITFQAITSAFPAKRHSSLARGIETALPVFIVGMPRSGTSLVEQILASHPNVHGAGERDDIARIVHGLGGPAPSPSDLARLTATTLRQAACDYLETLSRLAPGAARITDKMPHNFLALGYIDLLFPGCRIIHCLRDPRDTCLSIWFQQMTGNHPYTSDLAALADYYRHYQALMTHWKSVIRAPMLEVRYEDLVADIEQGARELVKFCDLDWNDQCLRFHENARVVSTPTYDEVRRPIHDRSVGRWRHYERHLGALSVLVNQPD